LNADAQAPAVPEGWRLVPVEPTEEMVQAGHTALMEWDARTGDDLGIENVYGAMLAAAPTPPASAAPAAAGDALDAARYRWLRNGGMTHSTDLDVVDEDGNWLTDEELDAAVDNERLAAM